MIMGKRHVGNSSVAGTCSNQEAVKVFRSDENIQNQNVKTGMVKNS